MKLSIVYALAADVVLDPKVDPIAYYNALHLVVGGDDHLQCAAEVFANPYLYDGRPQSLSRGERALLFGFLAEIAKQAGK